MKIEIPTNCPSCDSTLELTNEQLFCRSADCPAQSSKKLVKFCKTLKIKGFGEKTCEKLELMDISDLANFSIEYAVERGLSEKVATNLENELKRVESGVDFDLFLTAFSIPLFGSTASKKVAELTNSVDEINLALLKKAGIGEKASLNFVGWKQAVYDARYKEPLSFVKIKEKVAKSENIEHKGDVCISGKLNGYTKAQATQLLNEAGYEVKSSLTKSCVFLISEDGKESSKVKKAKQTNITIKTLEEILNG